MVREHAAEPKGLSGSTSLGMRWAYPSSRGRPGEVVTLCRFVASEGALGGFLRKDFSGGHTFVYTV